MGGVRNEPMNFENCIWMTSRMVNSEERKLRDNKIKNILENRREGKEDRDGEWMSVVGHSRCHRDSIVSGSLLEELGAVLSFGHVAIVWALSLDDAQVLLWLLGVVGGVVGSDWDNLHNLPTISHSRNHRSELLLVTLKHTINKLVRRILDVFSVLHTIDEQLTQVWEAVEVRLREDSLLRDPRVHDQFSVAEVIQNRGKEVWVSVDQIGTGLILVCWKSELILT